jgi:GTP-binding protein HflX
VGFGPKRDEWEIRSTLAELERLADTANAETVSTVIQYRDRPDPAWLVGKGKAEEIARTAELQDADLVIFDRELSPAQIRNLENIIPCKVIDRTQLILDIFAQRAQTREGRIQVELAQLQYMLPRLAGRGKELSRLGGGIGTRGPGEKKLETDRRHIRRLIGELKRELEEVKKHRRLHGARRKKSGIPQVALVGYTNAGKSTLLNRLTGAGVLAEDKLFATLDPTSRRLSLPGGTEVILTDTVGFIRNLPHHLVAAFRSTLEQVKEADLLLHVVDSSHPEAAEQIMAVERVLEELDASHLPVLMVLNKADKAVAPVVDVSGKETVLVSALKDEDLELLRERIEKWVTGRLLTATAQIPVDRGDWISALYAAGEVLESRVNGLIMQMEIVIPRERYERLGAELKERLQLA